MVKLNKRLSAAYEGIDRTKLYSVAEAVALVKKGAKAKFDETIDIAMKLGVDVRHADQQVRGSVNMPAGTGKTMRVVVFARDSKAEEAKAAGADVVGAEDLMEKIQGGWTEFDRCIASPDMMGVVGRLGKILGPRNLMPNPKLGTVTPNVADAVATAKGGEVQFRTAKDGIVHAGIAKASFSEEDLANNAETFIRAVQAAKPTGAKGSYIQTVTLSSTMGVGVKVDFAPLFDK